MATDRRIKPEIGKKTELMAERSAKAVEKYEGRRSERASALKKATVEIDTLNIDDDERKEKLKDAKKSIDLWLEKITAPSEIHSGMTGSGKTTSFLNAFEKVSVSASYYSATHQNLNEIEELRDDIAREHPRNGVIKARFDGPMSDVIEDSLLWWRTMKDEGEPRTDPLSDNVHPFCPMIRRAHALGKVGLPILPILCMTCPLKKDCEYFAQETVLARAVDEGKTILRTHHRIRAGSLIDQGHIKIIDEAFLASMVKAHSIPFNDVGDRDAGIMALLGVSAGAEAVSLLTDIAKSVRDHPGEPLKLREQDQRALGNMINRLSKAKDGAKGSLQPLTGIFEMFRRDMLAKGYQWLVPLEALFEQARTCLKHGVPLQSAHIENGNFRFLEIHKPDIGRDDALIVLDATVELDIMRRIFPERAFDVLHPEADHNIDMLHVVMPATNTLVGAVENSEGMTKARAAKNLEFIQKQNQAWGIAGKVAVFANKKVVDELKNTAVIPNATYGTFGSLRGSNAFKKCDSAIVYGQAARSHRDYELMAGALNLVKGNIPRKLDEVGDLDDGQFLPVDPETGLYYHPDDLTHAVYRQQIVAECVQAVGRLRAILKDKRPRVVVYGRHDMGEFGASLKAVNHSFVNMPRNKPQDYFQAEIDRTGQCIVDPLGFAAWLEGVEITDGMEVTAPIKKTARKMAMRTRDEFEGLHVQTKVLALTYMDKNGGENHSAAHSNIIYKKGRQSSSTSVIHTTTKSDPFKLHGKTGDFAKKKRAVAIVRKNTTFYRSDWVAHPQKPSCFYLTSEAIEQGSSRVAHDEIQTCLTTISSKKADLTKAFDRAPSGAVCAVNLGTPPLYWEGGVNFPVDSLEDVEVRFREVIHVRNTSAVIRGSLAEKSRGFQRVSTRKDGPISDVASRLVCFDIDDYELPDYLDIRTDAAMIARSLPRAMGKPFADAKCLVSWSASCGVKSRRVAKAHLWFWLDELMTTKEVRDTVKEKADEIRGKKARFDQVTVDMSTMTEVHMVFEGPPILEGVADPMPDRMVMVPGGLLCLGQDRTSPPSMEWQPNEDEEERAEEMERAKLDRKNSAARNKRLTIGAYEKALSCIGDDQEGFHEPVLKAVGVARKLIKAGKIDEDAAHEMLEAVVLSADRGGREADYIEMEASRYNFERLLDWHGLED